jgi:hypothetical protein
LSTYYKNKQGVWEQEDFETALRAAGETETTQENNKDWLELDQGNRGFQLLTGEEIAVVLFFLFSSALLISSNFTFICFLSFFSFKGYILFH